MSLWLARRAVPLPAPLPVLPVLATLLLLAQLPLRSSRCTLPLLWLAPMLLLGLLLVLGPRLRSRDPRGRGGLGCRLATARGHGESARRAPRPRRAKGDMRWGRGPSSPGLRAALQTSQMGSDSGDGSAPEPRRASGHKCDSRGSRPPAPGFSDALRSALGRRAQGLRGAVGGLTAPSQYSQHARSSAVGLHAVGLRATALTGTQSQPPIFCAIPLLGEYEPRFEVGVGMETCGRGRGGGRGGQRAREGEGKRRVCREIEGGLGRKRKRGKGGRGEAKGGSRRFCAHLTPFVLAPDPLSTVLHECNPSFNAPVKALLMVHVATPVTMA